MVVSFSYIGTGSIPPIWEFIVVAAVAPFLAVALKRMGGPALIYLAAPVLFGLAMFLGFSLIYAIGLAIVLCFRMEARAIKADLDNEEFILITTFILAIVSYIITFSSAESYVMYFILAFVLQLLIFFAGRFIYFYLLDESTVKHAFGKKVILIAITLGTVSIVTFIVFTLYPYIKLGLEYLIYWILYAFVWVLRPFFNFLEGVEIEPPEQEDEEIEREGEGMMDLEERQSQAGLEGIADLLMWIGIAVLVALALYLYYRYRKNLVQFKGDVRKQHAEESPKSKQKTDQFFWKRKEKHKAPKDRVRKEYYDLEKWAAANNAGRYESETVREWLERLEIRHQVKEDMLYVYETIRYGEEHDFDYDFEYYKQEIGQLKQLIKEKYDI